MALVIVDYGMGNLGSVRRSLQDQNVSVQVSSDPRVVESAGGLILPGVGAFACGMQNLQQSGLADAMKVAVSRGCPLLGICLGMQLLADEGDEGGLTPGLGLIPGRVSQICPVDPALRVPHVGWNEITIHRPCELLDGIADGADFYFVHSFEFKAADSDDVAATTPYGHDIVAVVRRGVVCGTQFHPEKSSRCGVRVLANFLKLAQVPC